MSFSHEQPPEDIEESLREYLGRRFIDVANAFALPSKFPERKEMPKKPQIGDLHYFGNPATHSYDPVITKEGFWGFTSIGWVLISGIQELGYGGILETSNPLLPDITSTPQIIPADAGSLVSPENVLEDFANNGIVILKPGVWQHLINVSLFFDDMNSGRTLALQLYDVTDAVVLGEFNFPVGRNQEGIHPYISFLADITNVSINDLLVIRILSAADTFENVRLVGYSYNVLSVDI